MARRGLCHCGAILSFRLGLDGYKTRCPQCGSVVRLRREIPAGTASEATRTGEETVELEPYVGETAGDIPALREKPWLGLVVGIGLFVAAIVLVILLLVNRS